MESCIRGNPNVRLKFTLKSSSSTTDVLVDDDSEESGDDEDQCFGAESCSAKKDNPLKVAVKEKKERGNRKLWLQRC